MSIENSGSIDIYSSPDYTNAVAKLYNIDPIAKGSNFFFGRKKDDGQIMIKFALLNNINEIR